MSSTRPLVLVHGAWHGAWCWERVLEPLARRGIEVLTLDLPSVLHEADGSAAASVADARSRAALMRRAPDGAASPAPAGLAADAAAVRALIEARDGEVVLCGHSYGGMVISLAASGSAPVARLVYLCAFVPQAGQSLVSLGGSEHAPWIEMRADGTTLPDLTRAAQVFYGDCDPATQSWAISRLRPQPATAFTEPVPAPAWEQCSSSYIVCARDQAMPAELQRTVFAPRTQDVHELDVSHSPFLSQPEALAELLARITRG